MRQNFSKGDVFSDCNLLSPEKWLNIPTKRKEKYLMFAMMKGHSVLHCVVWEKKVSSTGCRVGNPPHDLFLAHEKSGE